MSYRDEILRNVSEAHSEILKIIDKYDVHIEMGTSVFGGLLTMYVCDNKSPNHHPIEIYQGNNPVTDKCTISTIQKKSNRSTFRFDENNKLLE